MSRVKGVPLISSIGVLKELLGPARLQALTTRFPVESQQLFTRSLVALDMRAICKRDFSGIYRVYVKNTTAHEVLKKLPTSGVLTSTPAA